MTITITGSKYGEQVLSAAGTTTVQIAAAVFASGDFATPRRVDLYSSAGALKGHAFVRVFLNASSVQLEDVFRSWKTGAAAVQAVGDLVQVSKNFSEIGGTISVNREAVTVADDIFFGIDGQPKSVSFHDEGKNIVFTLVGGFALRIRHGGGVVSFGHLQNWVNKTFYGGCNFSAVATNYDNGLFFTSSAAYFYQFGGNYNLKAYYGSGFNGAVLGVDAGFMWCLGVNFLLTNLLSKNAGGFWDDGSNHVLEACTYTDGQDALMVRWGNGLVIGGSFKITNNGAILGVFGSDAGGVYPIGAPADKRAVVVDIGQGPLWRASGTPGQTINATNLISTDFRARTDGGAQPNATVNVAFQDSFTNLAPGTAGVIIRTDTQAVVQSVIGSGSSWQPTILYNRIVGFTQQAGFPLGPWAFGLKAYGYAPQGGAIAVSDFPLGSAGTAKNVVFGGFVRQLVDPGVTRAIGAIPATLATLDDLYDAMHAWSVASVANAQIPTVSTLPITFAGSSLNLGAFNLAVNSAAAPNFSIAGNTITVKAVTLAIGTKFTQFQTTGTITTSSAAVSAPFTDSTGNSFLQFESVDTWFVYSDAARTVQLGTGAAAQLFKFNFAANTVYYLSLVSAGEEFRRSVTPLSTGATVISLSSTALLSALNARSLLLAKESTAQATLTAALAGL